jgi:putative ABC transport system substrate-binding protein
MERRTFIKHLGGAAAYYTLAAHASSARSPMPIIGFLSATTREPEVCFAALRRGLDETGFQEGPTVAIEYRWAEDKYDRLPTMAAELSQHAGVIVAANYPAAVAAKKATKNIPIVFLTAVDPVTSGLVESLNRPNGNATGVYILNGLLEAKRLELLGQVVSASADRSAGKSKVSAGRASNVRHPRGFSYAWNIHTRHAGQYRKRAS